MEPLEGSRSERKHQAIMAAATTVFLSKGYDGTSVDDVAALAGVSKQTVYKHFRDKEGLFTEIILATTGQLDELVRIVASTLGDTADVGVDLRRLAGAFITALMAPDVLQLRRVVIANADRFPELGRAWYSQGFERVLETLATSFQRLAARKLLSGDPRLAADHFVGLLLWIPVNRAMFSGDTRSDTSELEAYADSAVRAFLDGHGRPSRSSIAGRLARIDRGAAADIAQTAK